MRREPERAACHSKSRIWKSHSGSVSSKEPITLCDVTAGQAIATGEWVHYSTPDPAGAEYIAICLPAISPQNVHRDAS